MAQEQSAAYTLVATYPDLEKAREALATLDRQGVDGTKISLLGRAVEEAQAATQQDTSAVDTGVSGDVTKAAVAGTAAGGVLGGVAGFLAGAAAFAIPGVGPVIGTGVWAATFGGATLGAGVGAHFGGLTALSHEEDWELTYQDALRAGRVLVAVQADTAQDRDRARQALDRTEPLRLDQFEGTPRPEELREIEDASDRDAQARSAQARS